MITCNSLNQRKTAPSKQMTARLPAYHQFMRKRAPVIINFDHLNGRNTDSLRKEGKLLLYKCLQHIKKAL